MSMSESGMCSTMPSAANAAGKAVKSSTTTRMIHTWFASQIGPIWEANHVWIILVVVLLFTAFPAAFAALGIVLHIPLSLMLIGIVLRGSSFVFRSYGARDDVTQQRWGRVFA